MGNGIAQVAAMAGYDVAMHDVQRPVLDRALATIRGSLGRLLKAGRIAEDQVEAAVARIQPHTDLAGGVKDADVVIEAVPEIMDVKQKVFVEIDRLCPPRAILASNTSGLSITDIAGATQRPEKVIGMHWFAPPVMMRLIEIVRGAGTADETVDVIREISRRMGKETVLCNDSPGFITSRALQALLNECFRIYDEGVASIEDIDKAIKLGLNHPMGPFELADYSGVDIPFHANEGLAAAFGERFRSPRCLVDLVASGNLGRKTGRGFYGYQPKAR
ncbi:MAG: 3-hydroxyacyl-CoA dehydrogenase family protein [Chloroflexi bacterium]|nr:3-hydroxyacyl-CoA dehydrogenase family protein [Chloroflexota bacterium]